MRRGRDRGKWPWQILSSEKAMIKLAKLSNTTISVLWKVTKGIQQIERHLFKKNWTSVITVGLWHFISRLLPFPFPHPQCQDMVAMKTGSLTSAAGGADPIWSSAKKLMVRGDVENNIDWWQTTGKGHCHICLRLHCCLGQAREQSKAWKGDVGHKIATGGFEKLWHIPGDLEVCIHMCVQLRTPTPGPWLNIRPCAKAESKNQGRLVTCLNFVCPSPHTDPLGKGRKARAQGV